MFQILNVKANKVMKLDRNLLRINTADYLEKELQYLSSLEDKFNTQSLQLYQQEKMSDELKDKLNSIINKIHNLGNWKN